MTHTLTYDGENRLTKVMNGATTIATFVYDGDGQRVKSTLNGVTTTFVGNYYEKTGTSITKYYYMGTARVAMRNTSVKYLFGDQLGSTSVTTSSSGVIGSQARYKPFGEMYYTSGTLPTRYTFTGQYSYANTTSEIGLMYYGARFYDPALGRFASADTIIPGAGNPMAWDRYAYTLNNPVKYTDPSGHGAYCGDDYDPACLSPQERNFWAEATNDWKTAQEYIDLINLKYGVTLEGNWSLRNLKTLLGALNTLDYVLGGITDLTYGTSYTFFYDSTEHYGGVLGDKGNLNFHGGNAGIPYQNFYHEIAHSINAQAHNYFTQELGAAAVYSPSGEYVMGGSPYRRNSDGYKAPGQIFDPVGRKVDAQQHAGNFPCSDNNDWCKSGNAPNEEWADLITNLAAGNFDRGIGAVRASWVYDTWESFRGSIK